MTLQFKKNSKVIDEKYGVIQKHIVADTQQSGIHSIPQAIMKAQYRQSADKGIRIHRCLEAEASTCLTRNERRMLFE